MTMTLLLLGFGVLFVAFLLRFTPWVNPAANAESIHSALEPIPVPALMNLIDPANLEFLRRSLSASEFRRTYRERNRVLRIYVKRIAHNTRVLIAAGAAAQRSSDPAVAESGRVLLETSLAVRTRALRAMAYLYAGELFPGLVPDLTTAIENYQSAAVRMRSLQSLNTVQ